MDGAEHETVSMEDLRAGFGTELLAEAEVILAVDADANEEALHGKWDWELAAGTDQESDLSVVRVELEASEDVDELKEMIDSARGAALDEDEEPTDDDGED